MLFFEGQKPKANYLYLILSLVLLVLAAALLSITGNVFYANVMMAAVFSFVSWSIIMFFKYKRNWILILLFSISSLFIGFIVLIFIFDLTSHINDGAEMLSYYQPVGMFIFFLLLYSIAPVLKQRR